MSDAPSVPIAAALTDRRGVRFLNLTVDDAIKYFFGGNALLAVVVLALITIFLFREGFGFFAQNRRNIEIYRTAGLEYVDIIRSQSERFTDLVRELNSIRLTEVKRLLKDGKTLE